MFLKFPSKEDQIFITSFQFKQIIYFFICLNNKFIEYIIFVYLNYNYLIIIIKPLIKRGILYFKYRNLKCEQQIRFDSMKMEILNLFIN